MSQVSISDRGFKNDDTTQIVTSQNLPIKNNMMTIFSANGGFSCRWLPVAVANALLRHERQTRHHASFASSWGDRRKTALTAPE